MQNTFSIPCKINLFLHIVGRRANGYHELESLFVPVKNPHDTITILDENITSSFQMTCNQQNFDLNNNTLTKTYSLFCEHTKYNAPLSIHLEKNIPSGAGLGGGSADAGFLLRYLYAQYKELSFDEHFVPNEEDMPWLNEIAVKVGADVPFFLQNKAMLIEGIGEKMREVDISFLKNYYILLLTPKIHVNTKEIFKKYREENQILDKKNKKSAFENLTSVSSQAIKPFDATMNTLFRNDLEQCVFSSFPALGNYKEKLIAFEAVITLMSGSGSSMFGVFSDKAQAEKAWLYFETMDEAEVFPIFPIVES